MQKIENQPILTKTNEDNSNLTQAENQEHKEEEETATSQNTLSNAVKEVEGPIAEEEKDAQSQNEDTAAHSDLELRPKIKTRSRLSRAFRSLSRSSRKKPPESRENKTKSLSNTPAESVISSGGEETFESAANTAKKKKSKLSGRFLLGGLRKSKVAAKESIEPVELKITEDPQPTNIELQRTKQNVLEVTQFESLEPSKVEVESSSAQSSPKKDQRRKVQITISAKKIEQTTLSRSSPIDSDYLTPSEEIASPQNTAAKAATTVSTTSPATPLAPSTASTTTTTTKTTSSSTSVTSAKSKKKLKTKKITSVIALTQTKQQPATPTQAKPASAATHSTAAPEEKIVITQSTRDTPPPERAPAKPSRVTSTTASQTPVSSGAVRKPTTTAKTSVAPLPQASKVAATKLTSQRSVTAKETELMQNPTGSSQRGHRFPKPAQVLASAAAAKVAAVSSKSTPTTQTAPVSTTTSKSTSSATTSKIATQQSVELQAKKSQEAKQTTTPQPSTSKQPTKTGPSKTDQAAAIVSGTASLEPQRLAERQTLTSSKPIAATVNLTKPITADVNIVSSAESAKPSELSTKLEQPTQPTAAVENPALENDSSGETNSESQSPTSEHNRRRIRYVAPSIFDVYDSLAARNVLPQFEPGEAPSEISLDSEYDSGDNQQMPGFGDLTMDQQMEPAIMTSSSAEKREHLYKILVIGELGTGKTSFIKRYVHQFFSQNYRATIGVDFALKVLHWDSNTIVRLQLWDIAGQERFGNMTRVYYKEAVGAFIVFDVTRSGTFDCVAKWKEDLDSKVQLPDGSPIPCILLANKCDQDKQGMVTSNEKMDEYVRENGFAGWFETSAKENINIDEAARALVNKILLNDKLISASDLADSERFNLNATNDQTTTDANNKCSC